MRTTTGRWRKLCAIRIKSGSKDHYIILECGSICTFVYIVVFFGTPSDISDCRQISYLSVCTRLYSPRGVKKTRRLGLKIRLKIQRTLRGSGLPEHRRSSQLSEQRTNVDLESCLRMNFGGANGING
jgi:hypothetical protein